MCTTQTILCRRTLVYMTEIRNLFHNGGSLADLLYKEEKPGLEK